MQCIVSIKESSSYRFLIAIVFLAIHYRILLQDTFVVIANDRH